MQQKINIAIDIRDAKKAFTGTKNYLQSLINIWAYNNNPFLNFIFIDDFIPVHSTNNIFLKIIEHIKFIIWKQISLPILVYKKKCAILFCTDYFLPFFQPGFKTVVVFHDAFFFDYPEHYNKIWLFLFKNIAIPAAKKASKIIVPSHYSKNKILSYTTFSNSKIEIIYEASAIQTTINNTMPSNEFLKKCINKKYILHVGTLHKNKNLVRLINAFSIVSSEDIFLVLVGKSSFSNSLNDETAIKKAIQEHNLEEKIILTGYIDERDLSIAFAHALMYIFPSYNEGFGIPLLEAFQHNIPVLAANNTSLPEIAKDAALFFDPFDETDIANKITSIMIDEKLRKSLQEKGKLRVNDFSWEKTATEINKLFQEIISSQ